MGLGRFCGRSSSCQTNSSVCERTLPKYSGNNWDSCQNAHPDQCPSHSFSLVLVEAVGDQQTDPNAKGNTSPGDQCDLRYCKTSLFHTLCRCKFITIPSSPVAHRSGSFRFASTATTSPRPNSIHAFFGNDRNHHQPGDGISPPPAQNGIQKKTAQQDCREVRTEVRLPRIGVHGSTLDSPSNPPLFSCK